MQGKAAKFDGKCSPTLVLVEGVENLTGGRAGHHDHNPPARRTEEMTWQAVERVAIVPLRCRTWRRKAGSSSPRNSGSTLRPPGVHTTSAIYKPAVVSC